ncbi:MAG: hypothetical protein D6731_17610 [Planctomycetota bacterium]|nr:MAG: hypothetical protein D6731_17610 [Planctomycetota bacterium]
MEREEPSAEQVAAAEALFECFGRCQRNLKLYPHYHANCVEVLGEFVRLLQAFHQAHGDLVVAVTSKGLALGERLVAPARGREDLAVGFYVDGVRELTVRAGAEPEEAREIALLFFRVANEQDLDSLLLLWESELPSLDYAALNSLTDPWDPPEDFSEEQVLYLNQLNAEVERRVSGWTQGLRPGPYVPQATASAEAPRPATAAAEAVLAALEVVEHEPLEHHGAALDALRAEARAWTGGRLLVNVVGHTVDGLALAPEVVSPRDAEWLFRRALDLALEGRDPGLLADLLECFRAAREEGGGEDAAFARLLDSLLDPALCDRVLAMVKGGAGAAPDTLRRVLDCLGAPGVEAAAKLYAARRGTPLAQELFEFACARLERAPRAAKHFLGAEVPALEAQRALAAVEERVRDEKELAELLAVARGHPSEVVSKKATKLWHKRTEEGKVEVLGRLLAAPGRELRLDALARMQAMKLVAILPRLKEAIASPDFLERDAAEQRAHFEALRRLGGLAAVGFLQQQCQRSTGIFRRKAAKDVRFLAREALEALRAEREGAE